MTSSIQVSEGEVVQLLRQKLDLSDALLDELEAEGNLQATAQAILAMRAKEQNQPVTVAAHPTLPVVVADGELEPCPWCGHAEALEIVDMGQTFGAVHCNGCGCDGPVDDGRPSRAWNTRAKEPLAQGDEVEHLMNEVLLHGDPTSQSGAFEGWGLEMVRRPVEAAIRAALVRSKLPMSHSEQIMDTIDPAWADADEIRSPIGEDVRERVARALRDETDRQLNVKSTGWSPSPIENYLKHADAAITAIGSQSIELRTVERKPFVIEDDEPLAKDEERHG